MLSECEGGVVEGLASGSGGGGREGGKEGGVEGRKGEVEEGGRGRKDIGALYSVVSRLRKRVIEARKEEEGTGVGGGGFGEGVVEVWREDKKEGGIEQIKEGRGLLKEKVEEGEEDEEAEGEEGEEGRENREEEEEWADEVKGEEGSSNQDKTASPFPLHTSLPPSFPPSLLGPKAHLLPPLSSLSSPSRRRSFNDILASSSSPSSSLSSLSHTQLQLQSDDNKAFSRSILSPTLHASTSVNTDMTGDRAGAGTTTTGLAGVAGVVVRKSAVAAEWSKCFQGPPSYSMRKKKKNNATGHLASSSSSSSSLPGAYAAYTYTHIAALASSSSSASSASSLLRKRAEENENLLFALEDLRSLHRQVVVFREWEVEDDIRREQEREQRLRDLEEEGKEFIS